MATFLTKSNFMSGLQCPKQLWLEVEEPHRATPLTLAQERIIDQGEAVGQLARQQFPGGLLIKGSKEEAIQATEAAISAGHSCLFEAAFNVDGVFIRCDILHQNSTGAWELIEVKSSSKIKDEHYWDVALQRYILLQSGLLISSTQLMHINTQDCVFPHLDNLFTVVDISAEVDSRLPEIPFKLAQFKTVLTHELEPPSQISQP